MRNSGSTYNLSVSLTTQAWTILGTRLADLLTKVGLLWKNSMWWCN